ncbi:MAG: hypothetical protein J7K08_07045 [Thermoplasmata archaeon]|nr:hypothetical protein [Thermoplasmata archaeon]RLF56064.1 MAG: hypothetical protein DRN28_01545 [Thermoplasmata archaeon]RLF72369.1 MAG: hypothetical protein DRN40_00365 [Thermoplasmata archaeon]RLF76546.1 MAG: hypothetical protein DRN42_00780 [Thermoplasmata archaeon]
MTSSDDFTAAKKKILQYTEEMDRIANMLKKVKAEIKKREENLKKLEEKIRESEARLRKKVEEIEKKDRQVRELEEKIAQKMEELRIQETQLHTNSALEFLTYMERERELKRREEELKKVDVESLKRRIEQLEEELKKRERKIEELEVMIKSSGGGGATAAVPEGVEELLAELKRREEELDRREEELKRREKNAISGVREADKDLLKIIEEREAQLERLAEELKREREEIASEYRRLSELERSLKRKEAELELKEKTAKAASTSSGVDIEKIKKDVESEYQKRVQMLENFYKEKMNTLLKKIEDLEARNAELLSEADQLSQERMRVTLMERELRERINELAFQEDRLSRQQEMLLKERKKLDEERRKLEELKRDAGGAGLLEKVREKENLLKEMEKKLKEKEEFLRKKEEELRMMEGKVIDRGLILEEEVDRQKALTKCRTGIRRFDDLMLGGLPFNSNFILYGPAYSGRKTFINIFIAEGLKRGIPAIYITTQHTPEEIREMLRIILPKVESYEEKGLLRYIDIYSKPMGLEESNPHTIYIKGPTELEEIKEAIYSIQKDIQDYPYHRLVMYSASTLLAYVEPMKIFRFFQSLNARNKMMNAVAIYVVDHGMHEPAVIQTLKHVMSGFIEFKVSEQKYQLRVEGGGDVLSRAWIEYVFTDKTFDLRGSFALDHIR